MDATPRRKLGKHDVTVSALGLGGHHVGDAESYAVAERIVHAAIEGGIDFFVSNMVSRRLTSCPYRYSSS